MAAVDKIYGTLAEHIALHNWVSLNAPALRERVNDYDTRVPTDHKRPIAQFPLWADEFLLNACEMEWVKDRIRDQYDLPAGATTIYPDTDDADYAQAGDDMLLADIEHLFEERDAKMRQLQGELTEKTGALETSNRKRQTLEERVVTLLKENDDLASRLRIGLAEAYAFNDKYAAEITLLTQQRDEARAQRDNLVKEVAVYRADWIEPSIKLQNTVIRDLDAKLRQEQAATKAQATVIAELEAKVATLQRERDEMAAQRKAWANAAAADPLTSRFPGDTPYYLEYKVFDWHGARRTRGARLATGPAGVMKKIGDIMTDENIALDTNDHLLTVDIYLRNWQGEDQDEFSE